MRNIKWGVSANTFVQMMLYLVLGLFEIQIMHVLFHISGLSLVCRGWQQLAKSSDCATFMLYVQILSKVKEIKTILNLTICQQWIRITSLLFFLCFESILDHFYIDTRSKDTCSTLQQLSHFYSWAGLLFMTPGFY